MRSLSCGAIALLMLAGCANQIPPSGGPVDDIGPVILATSPAPFTVGFDGDRVEFIFDEYVDQRSFEESVFLSPAVEDLEFDWSGKIVEIIFHEPLRDSTTYVLTVGTDVTDLEAARHNRMRESFTLAFSTGPSIDRGLIAGRIYPRLPNDNVAGVLVLAYHLRGVRHDTLNPITTSPDYVTQTGADGSFRLPHIRLGPYALLAIRDEYRNVLYDREADDFAVPAGQVLLLPKDTARVGMVLQLSREDTTGPRLIRIEPKDRNHVLIGFSEEVDTSAGRNVVVSIVDTVDGRSTAVFVVVPMLDDLKTSTVVCDYLTPDRPYVARADRVYDLSGNPGIPGTLARSFTGPSNVDTSGPRLVAVSMRDSTRDVDTDVTVSLVFSEPVSPETAPAVAGVFRTGGGTAVPAAVSWPIPTVANIAPSVTLDRTTWYVLTISASALQDWKNVPIRDTVLTLHLATRDVDNDGSIEGRVVDEGRTDTSGHIMVVAREIKQRQPQIIAASAASMGSFRLEGLSAGRFVVYSYRDRNANGILDAGKPFPFVPSERRSALSDTLRVRPRWPLEGLSIRIPR
ncbi:MAG: Ig-like domain-containing protein [Bacteroidota bacterium]